MARTALIVTYTTSHPHVVGVFFRALRLARALDALGWRTRIVNEGPRLEDPKLDALPPSVEPPGAWLRRRRRRLGPPATRRSA